MPPRVSVVIPVFNRPAPVRRAIASVLAQTSQDFEIVVVDDGSTDATVASVAALADPRIVLIRHERNRGGSAARNTGIHAASGEFIAFLDSDDEWLPTKLERQLEVFGRSDDQLALVYTGADRVAPDGSVIRHIPPPAVNLTRALLIENVIGETSLGMVRRSALNAIGGFDESLPSCQDFDLWLRICERFRAEVIPEPLVRIVKGDDRGRISLNASRVTLGRELYCLKHKEKMIREKVLHIYLRKSGWWHQRAARDAREARHCYLASLAAQPIAPLTYVLLLTSCVPLAWQDRVGEWKRKLAALFTLRARPKDPSWNQSPTS